MRAHPAAHTHYPTTRKYPPTGVLKNINLLFPNKLPHPSMWKFPAVAYFERILAFHGSFITGCQAEWYNVFAMRLPRGMKELWNNCLIYLVKFKRAFLSMLLMSFMWSLNRKTAFLSFFSLYIRVLLHLLAKKTQQQCTWNTRTLASGWNEQVRLS